MSRKPVFPRTKNGRIDLRCFDRVELPTVSDWLRQRLAGFDAVVPLGTKSDEDPEAQIEAVIRTVGPKHRAAQMLGQAVLELLDSLQRMDQYQTPMVHSLLALCQRVQMPLVPNWFEETLRTIAHDVAAAEVKWGPAIVREILYGAITQITPMATGPIGTAWYSLLATPNYATLALRGLSKSYHQRAALLRRWWDACDPAKRDRDLDYMILMAIRDGVIVEFRKDMVACWQDYGLELRQKIDAIWTRHGYPTDVEPVPTNRFSAITGAARRPELVLGGK